MVLFIIGLFIGTILGVIVSGICMAGKDSREYDSNCRPPLPEDAEDVPFTENW